MNLSLSEYAPLWTKSGFSFLEGASHPAELVEQAHRLGIRHLALTDRDGIYGVVQAHTKAKELGVHLIVGAEISIDRHHAKPTRCVLLAQDRAGYARLCGLISKGRRRAEKGHSILYTEELCDAAEGIIALCPESDLGRMLSEAFGDRIYFSVSRHLDVVDSSHRDRQRAAAKACGAKTVAVNEVLYHHASRKPLHDVLRCIAKGTTLLEAGAVVSPNSEHDLKAPYAMHALFEDDLQALWNTLEVAERCTFSLDGLRYSYPQESVPQGSSEEDWLRRLTYEGAAKRYPEGIGDEAREQIEKELSLIRELEYGGYFLTMYEIVERCKSEGILCQGRGSAANSIVCYCLGITAVDPVKLDLLFERFLSRERAEPPDIDLDIEHERREEIIQWVYQRYGRARAAMVCNVIRYRTRSAIRDVGKALGFPEATLGRLSKLMGSRFSSFHQEALQQAGLDPNHKRSQLLLQLVDEIRDFPRHLSVHPGGFLLCGEPIDTLVPVENATMQDRTVIQWDKYSVEELGLFKVDLLGLGAMTHLRKAFGLLAHHKGIEMGLADIPHDDPKTFELVSKGDTIGVFQIESRAQMSMLPRLRPKTYYDLVIEVAIVRPGPIQGDMVHPYLRRRQGIEPEEYPHPLLKKVLKKTLGVPIFQEQVMKVAMLVGGYSGGEADQLRKDMAAWKSSGRIENHYQRLTQRMIQNGIEPDYAERIFQQIRGFGEYGFPESHAASFALIAYATAWMRTHHPAVFSCALLNAQPMGFYSPSTIVEDAKRRGVEVRPVDARTSRWDCTLEPRPGGGHALRMGFRYVKGLSERDRLRLEKLQPPVTSLESFLSSTLLPAASAERLAKAGAFDGFGLTRRAALWEVANQVARYSDTLPLHEVRDLPLFQRLAQEEEVLWDYRTSHHSARGHPMGALRADCERAGGKAFLNAAQVNARAGGTRLEYVGLVICRQQPGTATGVTFFTLEDETGFVNVVVWRRIFEQYSVIARTAVLLGVRGKLQSEHGVVHLVAEELFEPEIHAHSPEPAGVETRSFH